MRALIYARVSLDPRGQGRSVTEQENECRTWADREGWTITTVITETGSASRYARSTTARKRWPEVTQAIATGNHDILLAWESSRTTRDLTDYTALRDLCATHNVLLGYSGTVYDLTNRTDRFRTGLDALLAEDESARTSERIARSVRARAAAGQPHGKLPYGYRREYDPRTGALQRQVPDETTAPIVAEITRRVGNGEALNAIARDLTNRGIPIPRPARTRHNTNAWLATTIKRLATTPTNAGRRTHQGQDVGPATWPPIVTPEEHARAVDAIARKTAHNPKGDATARHLLSGIARCGSPGCGGPLRRIMNRGTESYLCGWCYKVARKKTLVDNHVLDRLRALIATIPAPDPSQDRDEDLEQAKKELGDLEQLLDDYLDMGANEQMSPAAVAKMEAKLTPRIAAARRAVHALRIPPRLASYNLDDPDLIDSMTIPELRAFIRDAVTITVHPAGRGQRTFNPDLIEVTPNW